MDERTKRWPTKPIKYIASIIQGSTPDSTNEDYWAEDESSLIWVTPADMQTTGDISSSLRHISRKGYHSCGTQLVPQGSTVISTRAPIGKVNYSTAELCTNQGCKSLVTKAMDCRYLYWAAINAEPQMELCGRGTTFMELSAYDLGHIAIPVPPKCEQAAIATILDEYCTNIDETISTLDSQVTLLTRYRSSVIHEAVTHGLDPSVPTKNSGVDWIGDIPASWGVKRLKYLFDTSSGSTPDSSDWSLYDGNINWIQSGDLYGVSNVERTARKVTEKALRESTALKVYESPFVVMAMYGASVGNVAVSEIDACTNQACCVMLPHEGMTPKFLFYVLLDSQTPLKQKALGGTQPNISQVIIRNHKIPVPPISTQSEITDYLDARTAAIDAVLDTKRKQLDILNRRRQSLIYEYVTGKRRVTEEA